MNGDDHIGNGPEEPQEEGLQEEEFFDVTSWEGYETRRETHPHTVQYIEQVTRISQLENLLELENEHKQKLDNLERQRFYFRLGKMAPGGTIKPTQQEIKGFDNGLEQRRAERTAETGSKAEKILAGEEWRDQPAVRDDRAIDAHAAEPFNRARGREVQGNARPVNITPHFNERGGRGAAGNDAPGGDGGMGMGD